MYGRLDTVVVVLAVGARHGRAVAGLGAEMMPRGP